MFEAACESLAHGLFASRRGELEGDQVRRERQQLWALTVRGLWVDSVGDAERLLRRIHRRATVIARGHVEPGSRL